MHSASDQPGAGQQQIVRALRDLGKLRLAEDEPDSPAYVRDRTPLKKGQITTLALRDEFRRDPALPILIGDDIFIRGVRRGYALGEDLALTLGLLFRTLAPMRSRDNMRAVAEGIEAMEREETAYWLGMAMHRKHPRRVLTALRMLLTEPRGRRGMRGGGLDTAARAFTKSGA